MSPIPPKGGTKSFILDKSESDMILIPSKWHKKGWKYVPKEQVQDPTKKHPNFFGFNDHTKNMLKHGEDPIIKNSHYKATFIKKDAKEEKVDASTYKDNQTKRELKYPPLIYSKPKPELIKP